MDTSVQSVEPVSAELCWSSSEKFSNRSDPKRQLEASNQFYSLLWSKKATLQTVIDNLLTHGINNQNEDISSGMVFRDPWTSGRSCGPGSLDPGSKKNHERCNSTFANYIIETFQRCEFKFDRFDFIATRKKYSRCSKSVSESRSISWFSLISKSKSRSWEANQC